MVELFRESPDRKSLKKLGNQIEFLLDPKVAERIAYGTVDELFQPFKKLFRQKNAERPLEKAGKERHETKSVE